MAYFYFNYSNVSSFFMLVKKNIYLTINLNYFTYWHSAVKFSVRFVASWTLFWNLKAAVVVSCPAHVDSAVQLLVFAQILCTYPVTTEVLRILKPVLCFYSSPGPLQHRTWSTSVWLGSDFTLRCPLIGGQQPSSTVMLDLWMKPLPHCKNTSD